MRRAIRSRLFLVAVFLAAGLSALQSAHAASGQLVLYLEGNVVGAVPPSVVLQGAERQESVLLGTLAASTGEIRFTDIPPGLYSVSLEGATPPDHDLPRGMEVAIAQGGTSVLRLDLNSGTFRSDPFRPDPFGVDETWDDGWLEMLPGAGDAGALAALTSPAPPRQARIEGLDISGSGFRHRIRMDGESIARTVAIPLGPVSAAHGEATQQFFARTQADYADVEAATGFGVQTSGEGTFVHTFPAIAGKPRVFTSIRGLKYIDAAPSLFEDGRLPHSGLQGIDLLMRGCVDVGARTQLTGILYGEGTIRKYFLEAYRFNPRHGPREERANLQGAMRATHDMQENLRLIGEVSLQRTFIESGDGTYFDNLFGYSKEMPQGADNSNLYWLPGHIYDYFHRKVHVDWTGRLEAWMNSGTDESIGAGIWARKGTYRSYEHLKPTNVWLDVEGGASGGYNLAQSIGYNETGEEHGDEDGMEPGKPTTLSAFLTARHPMAGGEIEVGLRGTHYRPNQRPLQSLSSPLGDDENFQQEDLGEEITTTTVDPRVGFTRALSDRTRFWLAGGAETWLPPSEAVYFSSKFIELAAFENAPDPTRPTYPIFGNPGLEPERAWTALAAIGRRFSPAISIRVGIEGRKTTNAITPRAFLVDKDYLSYYVNDGNRDLIDLSIRTDWEPSPRVRVRGSYGLSRMRTETVEPSLLDAVWLAEDLPTRLVDLREGLPPVLPPYDDGVDRGFFPSLYDRRHRLSLAVAVRTPADLLGETGRLIFSDLDVGLLFRLASGRPFTQAEIYPAGSLDRNDVFLDTADGYERNAARTDWIGQIDLRLGRTFHSLGLEGQFWVEITNLTDQKNTIHVYPATGEGDDDAYLMIADDQSREYAETYTARIRDHYNYGDPVLLHAGLRIRLP